MTPLTPLSLDAFGAVIILAMLGMGFLLGFAIKQIAKMIDDIFH